MICLKFCNNSTLSLDENSEDREAWKESIACVLWTQTSSNTISHHSYKNPVKSSYTHFTDVEIGHLANFTQLENITARNQTQAFFLQNPCTLSSKSSVSQSLVCPHSFRWDLEENFTSAVVLKLYSA